MSAPSITSYGTAAIRLKDEYSGGSMYGGNTLSVHTSKSIENNGFMGSANTVFLSSHDSITHETPACIAAPFITMVAKKVITLGIKGRGDLPVPVRLYAPVQLSITTGNLFVGDITILVEPQHGFIACKKLTLSKSTEEEPASFEIVKSWMVYDDTEIEIIRRTPS